MGKNSQARRAAKAKQRARQRAQEAHTGHRRGPGSRDPGAARHRPPPDPPPDEFYEAAERTLVEQVARLWEHGWQPAELHRHAHLQGRTGPVARLVELAVTVDCSRRRDQQLDPRWREQAERLDRPGPVTPPGWVRRWATEEGLRGRTAYPLIEEALHAVLDLPPLDELIPPPGRVGSSPRSRPTTADPVLQRVRALLAKAESTEFEAEATALTAKAQEMITRHAIDTALLDAEHPGEDAGSRPALIRIPVDPPYVDAKSLLLQTVAAATRCRAVSMSGLSMSNVVGLPADLAAVEVLFTSLLVQAQHALTEAGRTAGPGARPRSQSFRSAFLLAYSQRIGERLEEINEHVFGAAESESARFVPVLRSQADAVDDFVAERFGELTSGAVRGGYDASGWATGRLAADQARLAGGHLTSGAEHGHA